MTPVLATDVRKQWSTVCDEVIRNKPQFIKRTRDLMLLSDLNTLLSILSVYQFTAKEYIEDDGSVTLTLDQIDLIENGKDENTALTLLGESILEYANDYYDNYDRFFNSKNRREHIPYVLKALIINDPKKIGGSISCQVGEN